MPSWEQWVVYRALRKTKRLTQKDVAAELGVTQSMISQVERGTLPVPREREDAPNQRVDRALLDSVLALGDFEAGSPLRHTLGVLGEDDRLDLLEPVGVISDRDLADAAAQLLYALGLRAIVVAPLWPSFLRGRENTELDEPLHHVTGSRVLRYIESALHSREGT